MIKWIRKTIDFQWCVDDLNERGKKGNSNLFVFFSHFKIYILSKGEMGKNGITSLGFDKAPAGHISTKVWLGTIHKIYDTTCVCVCIVNGNA